MGELIPLFPLGSPLFPGVVLPLHIFEPRYRRLMTDLLALPPASDRRFFGVVAIRSGWEVEQVSPARALYDIGCTAELQSARLQPDGGFRVVTRGRRRFRLLDVVVGEDPPYLQGEVEWLPEEPADAEHPEAPGAARGSLALLAGAVRELFTGYVAEVAARGAGGDEEEAARLMTAVAEEPRSLSWVVPSVALLTTEDRQALLAESLTRRRLTAEARLLRRELALLQTLGAVPVPLQELAVPMAVN
jgi:Lon protease-like protein